MITKNDAECHHTEQASQYLLLIIQNQMQSKQLVHIHFTFELLYSYTKALSLSLTNKLIHL